MKVKSERTGQTVNVLVQRFHGRLSEGDVVELSLHDGPTKKSPTVTRRFEVTGVPHHLWELGHGEGRIEIRLKEVKA